MWLLNLFIPPSFYEELGAGGNHPQADRRLKDSAASLGR